MVDGASRRELERRYRLTRPEAREGTTWAYYVADTSRANLRALVADPAVEDTHNINRRRFSISSSSPRDPFRGPAAGTLPGMLGFFAWLLAASAVVAGLVAVAPRRAEASWVRIQRLAVHLVQALARIAPPPASAESTGAFRVVLGLLLLAIVIRQPISDDSTWTQAALLAALAAFVAGFQARVSYGLACAGLVVWAMAGRRTTTTPMTRWSWRWPWLAAPWGDAWSLDAVAPPQAAPAAGAARRRRVRLRELDAGRGPRSVLPGRGGRQAPRKRRCMDRERHREPPLPHRLAGRGRGLGPHRELSPPSPSRCRERRLQSRRR